MKRRYWLIPLAGVFALGLTLDASDPFDTKLNKDEKILHALSRLSFGARPGDVERVKEMGLDKWIDNQLHPERIKENPALAAKLAPLDTLRMSSREMAEAYPPRQLIQAVANNPALLPKDPAQRAMFERLSKQMEARKKPESETPAAARPLVRLMDLLTPEQLQTIRGGSQEERVAMLQSLDPEKRRQVLEAMPAARRIVESEPEMRREALKSRAPQQVVVSDLVEGKLQRALYSERQLEEVLVDFWFNHFNVYLNKGADRLLVTDYEREAIRPHVLGKFKDLVAATAKHPAMLFYLDNWQSASPNPSPMMARRRAAAKQKQAKRPMRGLNENYGRELLELHTLGVDGGYTQQDVIEVARAFTGWTIQQPRLGGDFFFNPVIHDRGEKTVLGQKIAAGGGVEDGQRVIDILVQHASTARHVSRRLAQRFVADEPPEELVERMAATFKKTGGDLREVMRTMIDSKEFFSRGAWRAKLKSPLELVVSATRAVDADVRTAGPLDQRIGQLGQPLYRKQEPTGYSNNGEEWLNTAGLLGRMNFGLALTGGQLTGVKVDTGRFAGKAVPEVAKLILNTEVTEKTRETIAKGMEGKQSTPALVAGLVIGSPDFQRR